MDLTAQTITLTTLILALIPVGIAMFAGSWILLNLMVFKPLDKISDKLEDLSEIYANHENRIVMLEYKDEQRD